MKLSNFYDSSYNLLSCSLLLSTFGFSFVKGFDMLIEFLEVEKSISTLHCIVSSFKLCNKA